MDEQRLPKVTAIVPCYNSAKFLRATLDCLAKQTWPNLEILIGDDCSTDDTLEIARSFALATPQARVIANEKNMGWLRNSNHLMSLAEGELMFFAFHDDLVAPDYVEKLARVLIEHPEAVLAFSDVELHLLDGSSRVLTYDKLTGLDSSLARAMTFFKRSDEWWVPNRGLFRSSAFAKTGGIPTSAVGEVSADWTWLLSLTLLGSFIRVPEVLCHKFFKKTSLSLNWSFEQDKLSAALRQAGFKVFRESALGPMQKMLLIGYFSLPRPFSRETNARIGRWVLGFLEMLNLRKTGSS